MLITTEEELKKENGNNLTENLNVLSSSVSLKHDIKLFIFGCGTVGGQLLEQIKLQKSNLLKQNIALQVCGIANSQGVLISDSGIDLETWKEQLSNRSSLKSIDYFLKYAVANQDKEIVLVDCTASERISQMYSQFLNAGLHIVTANKLANTNSYEFYRDLRRVSLRSNKKFLYETNIGAGLPVIEPLRRLVQSGDKLLNIEGILSGSLSFIFGEIHQGLSFSQATLKAKSLGFTEPDARQDLNGMDVARKALILAREFGYQYELEDIEIEPIIPKIYLELPSIEEFEKKLPQLDAHFIKLVEQAKNQNKVLKYVAVISPNGCKVSIKQITEDNALYEIKDGENVLAYRSQYYDPKPLVIRGYGAGAKVTAAGVFSDILRLINQ